MKDRLDIKYSVFGHQKTPEQTLNEWYKVSLECIKKIKTLHLTKENLLEWIHLYQASNGMRRQLEIFVEEKAKVTKKNSRWSLFIKKFNEKANKIDNKPTNLLSTILKHEKKIKSLLALNELKIYRRFFDTKFFQMKKHLISEIDQIRRDTLQPEKEINGIFEALKKDELAYGAYDEKGIAVTGSWYKMMTNDSRYIRKGTWLNCYSQFFDRRNLYARLIYELHHRFTQKASFYNFASFLEVQLFENYEITLKQYDKILQFSKLFKKTNIRYKDQIVGIVNREFLINDFKPWDYLMFNKLFEMKLTKQQAIEIILETFKMLGQDFYKSAQWVFNHKVIKWEDKELNSSNGYVFMNRGWLNASPIHVNFDGSLESLGTLAHEVGHAVVAHLINKKQKFYTQQHYLLVEIPSVLCEILIYLYCYDKFTHRRDKLNALNLILCYFSFNISNFAADEIFKIITDDFFIKSYKSLTCQQLAKAKFLCRQDFEGLTKYENQWYKDKEISNFVKYKFLENYYSNFKDISSIQYYLGFIIGLVYAWDIYHGDKEKINDFMKFLKLGSSKHPLECIKTLKISLLDKKVYVQANDILKTLLKTLELEPTLNKPGSLQYGKQYQEFNDKYNKNTESEEDDEDEIISEQKY